MKIILSGCAGFIGSNILRELIKKHDVIGIDNLLTGHIENIEDVRDEFEFVLGDLTDIDTCNKVCKGADMICHQAALPSVPRSISDPIKSNFNNVTATVNLLKAAVDNDVKRIVMASSSSVYGNQPTLPKIETMIPAPVSPYAVSKLTGEYYLKSFCNMYGIDGVSLRYYNVFGPRQDQNSAYAAVIPKFITAALSGNPITVYGDGSQSRDFTFIDNVINANIRALKSEKNLNGEVINIACGKSYTILDLIDVIEKVSGKTLNVIFDKDRAGDVKHSLADISKAEQLLGYVPIVGFEEGIKTAYNYYRRAI